MENIYRLRIAKRDIEEVKHAVLLVATECLTVNENKALTALRRGAERLSNRVQYRIDIARTKNLQEKTPA